VRKYRPEHRRLFAGESPYGDQSDWALAAIQSLESWRQREDLKLVFNRLMQTRMPGGVGGVRVIGPLKTTVVPMEHAKSDNELRGAQDVHSQARLGLCLVWILVRGGRAECGSPRYVQLRDVSKPPSQQVASRERKDAERTPSRSRSERLVRITLRISGDGELSIHSTKSTTGPPLNQMVIARCCIVGDDDPTSNLENVIGNTTTGRRATLRKVRPSG
jgi:hypothetical protein